MIRRAFALRREPLHQPGGLQIARASVNRRSGFGAISDDRSPDFASARRAADGSEVENDQIGGVPRQPDRFGDVAHEVISSTAL